MLCQLSQSLMEYIQCVFEILMKLKIWLISHHTLNAQIQYTYNGSTHDTVVNEVCELYLKELHNYNHAGYALYSTRLLFK